jgi:uncharacterized protein YgiM (DUF1202 family)
LRRNRCLAVLLLWTFVAFPSAIRAERWTSDPEPFPFLGLVTADRVNLRAGPGLSYEVLLSLPRRFKLEVFSRVGEWYGVGVPEEVSGYVHRDDVVLRPEGWAVVRKQRVHVRAGSSFASTSLGIVDAEQMLRVRGVLEEWIQVQVPESCRAWVHEDYVTFLGPLPEGRQG